MKTTWCNTFLHTNYATSNPNQNNILIVLHKYITKCVPDYSLDLRRNVMSYNYTQ